MGVVVLLPEAELCQWLQRFQLAVFQNGEHLIGGRLHIEAVALGSKALLQTVGGLDGVPADAGVQIIGEQHIELQAHQTALGKQRALLLDHSHKVGRCAVGEHHGLAAQRAHLGAADVEHIGQAGDILQGNIGALGHQTVAQACAVHEQGHVVLLTHSVQLFQLSLGVQGAVLGRVRDIYHAGEHHVVVVGIGIEGGAPVAHIGGTHLALVGGQGNDLVAGILNGTGFVCSHMAGGSSHHALPALQHGRNDDGVGLGAAGDEGHVCIRAAAGSADLCFGAGAVGVGAIAGHLFKVGLGQLLQDGRVCTLTVVVLEIQHIVTPDPVR